MGREDMGKGVVDALERHLLYGYDYGSKWELVMD